jgi:hypothetical protein
VLIVRARHIIELETFSYNDRDLIDLYMHSFSFFRNKYIQNLNQSEVKSESMYRQSNHGL